MYMYMYIVGGSYQWSSLASFERTVCPNLPVYGLMGLKSYGLMGALVELIRCIDCKRLHLLNQYPGHGQPQVVCISVPSAN